jgi:hypothetical protein
MREDACFAPVSAWSCTPVVHKLTTNFGGREGTEKWRAVVTREPVCSATVVGGIAVPLTANLDDGTLIS